ncbi:outer membrane protein assembly factor BamB family protein [Pontibacter russatus]|uniref:outer membrane protein assembly factor BamB family protein n=1 Tax=Pontibacter russatus TaxID=2694929 RepID=UPI0013799503|nr:PQQ-binding-like beta-propeller repeat protein [Pontibacter russatus]
MKNAKILWVALFFSVSFVGCKDDDVGDLLPPGADFNYTPAAPVAEQEILFYADPTEGSGEIVEWNWSFGDAEGSTSDKRNPYFTYASEGTYEVTLVVKNAAGASFEVTKPVEVAPPPKDFIAAIVWEFTNNTAITGINEGTSAPVVGDDGSVFYVEGYAGPDSKVVAVTDQGESAQLKWATAPGNRIQNAPSMGPDGNIYIEAWLANGIFKLNGVTGEIMWNGNTVAQVSNNTAAIDAEGNIYHGSRSNAQAGIFSWTPDGEKRWEIVGVGAFYAAPAISKDGKTVYYLNTDTGKIWAVNTADGTLKWSDPVGANSGGYGPSLSLDGEGTIYFTTNEQVAAVTDNGESGSVKWIADIPGAANSGVSIGPGGELYTGAGAGLVSLNPSDGSVNWTYGLATTESMPAVDVNGNIYIGTTDGKLVVVNPEGMLLKEFQLGDGVVNSPTIADDGTVYIEAVAGSVIKLYKIAVEESGPALSPWPMKGQNKKNTGQVK